MLKHGRRVSASDNPILGKQRVNESSSKSPGAEAPGDADVEGQIGIG